MPLSVLLNFVVFESKDMIDQGVYIKGLHYLSQNFITTNQKLMIQECSWCWKNFVWFVMQKT